MCLRKLDCQKARMDDMGLAAVPSGFLTTASVLGYLLETITNLNCIRLEYFSEPNHGWFFFFVVFFFLPLKAETGFLRLVEELEGWKERKMCWQITRACS